MSQDTTKPALAPYAFAPKPGQTRWWTGDPMALAELVPGERHRHIIVRPGVLDPGQCKVLIDCFERNRETCSPKGGNPFWVGRYIWQNALPEQEIDAIRIMQQVRFLALTLLCQAVRPDEPIYSDTAQLVRWTPGHELPAHTDNTEPDGRPNPTPHRSFSSLLYLNDGYDGGETYFPGHGVRLKPQAGTLVLFGAGPEYVHGVTRVVSGLRYTYAGWFTFEKTMEDTNAPRVF